MTSGTTGYSNSSFDSLGRVLTATQTTNGTGYIFQLSYKPQVGIQSLTFPNSNRVITTGYDTAGRPSTLTSQIGASTPTPYVTSTTYQPHGSILSQTLASGNLTYSCTDNERLQPATITATNLSSQQLLALTYTYSATQNNGNVATQAINRYVVGAWTQSYGYTEPSGLSVNRLTTASESGKAPGARASATTLRGTVGCRAFRD